ncbi:hypothetical protein D3C81_1295400 [compost metagenome]
MPLPLVPIETDPSGARTTPPWLTVGPDRLSVPKTEYGVAGSASPTRSMFSTRVGSKVRMGLPHWLTPSICPTRTLPLSSMAG